MSLITSLEQAGYQRPLPEVPDECWDVVIAGAGPAGSTAACNLAARGHRVLLLDRESFPREKICGDGLIADSIRCLERLGLLGTVRELAHESAEAAVFSPARVELRVPGTFLTIRRKWLDAILARKAAQAGAFFSLAEVERLESLPSGGVVCTAKGSLQEIRARTALVATGVRIGLLKPLGMVEDPQPTAVAIRCYVRSRAGLDRLVISYDRSIIPGYAWIFPMGGQEYNVGCGVAYNKKKEDLSLRAVFDSFTREFPLAREVMEQGERISPLRGALLRCGLRGTRPLGWDRILTIGEAVATTFPYTGEGIGKAMESGELAADVVDRALRADDFGLLDEYPSRLRTELEPRYYGYKMAEKWMSWAWLCDFVARRAQKSRFIQESFAGIINETVDPRAVFSVKGILKSFFS